jgi:two-component system, response regulator FlrC
MKNERATMNQVLIVEDDDILRGALTDTIDMAGYKFLAAENGEAALQLLESNRPCIIVSDVRMEGISGHELLKGIQKKSPGIPVILITAHGTISDAVEAMRFGAVDYLLKPFEPKILMDKIEQYMRFDEESVDGEPIAEDPKSQELISLALRVANSEVTVLISGESGTGKEVLAHYIHDHSIRKEKPFVAINCAAIPEQMLEATLFGYEKGAFTGAYKPMPGKFEQAQGGTLLLDEISEMDLALQAKLLRVLQEKEVERIGGTKLIPLDVRVLATSNRDMKKEVENARFREDLYYRLNVFPLHWIPLRERPQDIIPVAEYLINRNWDKDNPKIPKLSKKAKQAMKSYSWPGNAREMDNVIQRAIILQTGGNIEAEDLQLPNFTQIESTEIRNDKKLTRDLQTHEFDLIEDVLNQNKGNRHEVASILGISERTLRYKLAKMRESGYQV